jgi:hypothetical protein
LLPSSIAAVLWLTLNPLRAQTDCGDCHGGVYLQWAGGVHASTQTDVATELSQSDVGLTPADVIQQEDCLACHGPTAVQANGPMSESQAMSFFFTTSNGQFSASTTVTNAATWPHVDCVTCHNVPDDHPATLPALALFNSQTAQYVPAGNASALCGQCHGNLHFADTDHLIYNAWTNSGHAHTQTDVANELSQSDVGLTPPGVTQQEDCIGCHAPTAVLANGGMNESQALAYFFTTSNGVFTADTISTNHADWPGVGCTTCHDPHDPKKFSYFNSATKQYQVMTNSAQLCGQCHGNLRFPDTDHLSYNIVAGTGGLGVANQQTMPGATCTDCHMYTSNADPSLSKSFHGHTWAITVTEPDGSTTTSCTICHANMDTTAANASIASAKAEFQALDTTVQANVSRAAAAMSGVQNPTWLAALQEAQHNLTYAESDESGGFHNHSFLMALLNDANAKALSLPILTVSRQGANVVISWSGAGTLQGASSITGPWSDVPSATNPITIAPVQARQQFYRLRP